MAISGIHPIYSTSSRAVEYIINPDKTDNGLLTYSYACDIKNIDNDFQKVRNAGTGKGYVLAQHIHQSFQGKEVSPELALQCGIELADKFLKGNYQYVVATHINTNNIHNHIIFNNISFDNFRSFEYQDNRNKCAWKNLRKLNDEICKEHNLNVIINPQEKSGKCYYEWQQDCKGKSWKSKLRFAIDNAIMESSNFDDFLKKLESKDIECKYTPQNVIKIKFRMKGQERFARGRTIGWYYDEPQIRRRIEQYNLLKNGILDRTVKTNLINTNKDVFQTNKGLLRWAEVKNMKEVSKMINFLTTHNFSSEKDIENTQTSKYNDRMIIVQNLNKMQNKIDDLSDVIKILRTYKKYKGIHYEYTKAINKIKYKKDHAVALNKYNDAVKKLVDLYPDKKIPNLENLEKEKSKLLTEVKALNEEYKSIVQELEELEKARQTINDYVKNIDKQRNSQER